VPVAAPSANRSGRLSPTTAAHVAAELDGAIDLILDGGPCPGGIESTVVDVTAPAVRLLRPGPITVTQLEAVVGPVGTAPMARPGDSPMPSPGMMTRHYAPWTPVELVETEDEAISLVRTYETAGLKVARLSLAGSPGEVAARLYADLRALDAGGFDRIIVVLPPAADEWRAVRDRLTRAAAES
jgi:L-threonylcarbamoyladenylate synthase